MTWISTWGVLGDQPNVLQLTAQDVHPAERPLQHGLLDDEAQRRRRLSLVDLVAGRPRRHHLLDLESTLCKGFVTGHRRG